MGLKKKKWFQTLLAIAPKVAAGLGGPIAGLAMNTLKGALGMPDATEAEIEKRIAEGSPETFLALRKAAQDFDLKMREFDIQEDQLEYADVADARARQLATKDWTPAVLTATAIIFFGFLSYSILGELDIVAANEKFIWYLLGCASAWVTQGFNFHLGSSKGSQRKTDLLADGKL